MDDEGDNVYNYNRSTKNIYYPYNEVDNLRNILYVDKVVFDHIEHSCNNGIPLEKMGT